MQLCAEPGALKHLPSNPAKRFPKTVGGLARLAYVRLKAAGLSPRPLLIKTGLTSRQILDQRVYIKADDQINFVNLAAEALQDEFLGYHLALGAELREMGLLYYVLASSKDIAEAMERATRYSSIVNESVSLKWQDGRRATMSFRYVGVSRHRDCHQAEFSVAVLVRACRQLTGRPVSPVHVRFTHFRKDGGAKLSELFGSHVEFGSAVDEFAFAAEVARLPLAGADPHLNELLVTYCEEAIRQKPRNSSSFYSCVENAIVPILPHGKVHAGEIAARLGLANRTFARRLSKEGLTYSVLLQRLRLDLANRYLADLDLSISQIAWLLGFQETAAFSRAFRHWTGRTPRQSRSHPL